MLNINKIKDYLSERWFRTIVEIAVFFILLGTFIKTCSNIEHQKDFYHLSLRPWVSIDSLSSKDIPIVIQQKVDTFAVSCTLDCRKILYQLKNTGKTPAYHIQIISYYDSLKIFPNDTMIKFKETNKIVEAYLFRETDKEVSSVLIPMSRLKKTRRHKSDDSLSNVEKVDLYLHFYIEYQDIKNVQYPFQCTFKIELNKDETGITFSFIYSEEKELDYSGFHKREYEKYMERIYNERKQKYGL
ncbi:MAG: hypothetical protein E3J87_08200 [Candidatus Cloacimonadota bacterium]|nr:MAG: hypothetical protein E3J87_08200 [Candidatus Cloacimonadota bacterium]